MSRHTSVRPEAIPVLTGPLWSSASAEATFRTGGGGPALPGSLSRCGDLEPPDGDAITLARGFTGRVVGRSGQRVGGLTWHAEPGAGACFPDGDGWIYASNSDIPLLGGVSAIRFGPDGAVRSAYRILSGTDRNRTGEATPWDTWLSCEETSRGRIFECDPYGEHAAMPRLAMGLFRHAGAAFDPSRTAVYLTEGERDGCFYRFRPEDWGDLTTGVLEVMVGGPGPGPVTWRRVPNPAALFEPTREQVEGAKRFAGSGDCHYSGGLCRFATAGDGRVWAYDAENEQITVLHNADPRSDMDGVAAGHVRALVIAEHGDGTEMAILGEDGARTPFLRILGRGGPEVTGPAFSPDGARLYFSARHGGGSSAADVTYEITGRFRR
ncbi:alkaline phosphatase PhoX [Microtetraspora malaysiensis]|uniref:alkaline phosphatase PhoX n=1 Tax=Microtetraspora malaysiensis TaxID=161358 RepID=UPI00083235FD|nr:alkaline phosphatase PhoX [Microtetraspora malaysiensis]